MERRSRAGLGLAAAVLAGPAVGTAVAGIAYDNITGNAFAVTFVAPPSDEFAGHTRLAAGAGLSLVSVELCLRNVSQSLTYDAPVWVGLYTDTGAEPGVLVAERTAALTLGPGGTGTLAVDFTGVTAPGESFWTSFRFAPMSPFFLGIGSDGSPTVGSTTGWTGRRIFGEGSWTMSAPTSDAYGFRINSVPCPRVGAVTLVGGVLGVRRRRATR